MCPMTIHMGDMIQPVKGCFATFKRAVVKSIHTDREGTCWVQTECGEVMPAWKLERVKR